MCSLTTDSENYIAANQRRSQEFSMGGGVGGGLEEKPSATGSLKGSRGESHRRPGDLGAEPSALNDFCNFQ